MFCVGGLFKPKLVVFSVFMAPCCLSSTLPSALSCDCFFSVPVSQSGELQLTSAPVSVIDAALLLLLLDATSFPFTKRTGLMEVRGVWSRSGSPHHRCGHVKTTHVPKGFEGSVFGHFGAECFKMLQKAKKKKKKKKESRGRLF